ncbi:component of the polarisome [Irineochytrium annulatum]|nr:component of the polarisome [Irineochytrium annulatum]
MSDFTEQQYESLRSYLDSYLNSPRQLASAKSNQRISARERLSGLSKQQLLDLVTDVYDEIERRTRHANELPFLPIRPDLHQKRNQARQKLATMGTAPFKDFASDIMSQIERRFPHYVTAYDTKFGSSQANHSLDSSGPFSEEPGLSGSSQAVNGRGRDVESAKGPSQEVFDRMRNDYEAKIESMRQRMEDLEREFDDKRNLQDAYRKLEEDHLRLKEDYDLLQEDFNSQQQTSNDIRTEASNLIEEIKDLTLKNDQMSAEIDTLRKRLKDDQTPSKTSYPSAALSPRDQDTNGVIDRARVSAYQGAVDDLLRAARSDTPSSVLIAMKAIVIACKNITEDTEVYETSSNSLTLAEKDRLEEVKGKLSGALTGLMQSAKNHATNVGSSSVALMEGSASNLTATIVELVKFLKLKGGQEFGGDDRPAGNGDSQRNFSDGADSYGSYDLKVYLERQTDLIVQAIQTLLHTMRQSANGDDFQSIIQGITQTVGDVIRESDRTMSSPGSEALRDRVEPILQDLNSANLKLDELGLSIVDQPQSKTLKQRIASSSYDIARFVKELISIIGETEGLD